MRADELRVVMVIPSLGATGGLERVATTLALGVAERVERLVVCFARRGPFEQTLRDAGVELVRIHRPRPRPDELLRGAAGLTRVLARERPHLVHAHNPAAATAAAIARLAAGTPRTAVVASFHGVPSEQTRLAAASLRRAADLVVGVGPTSTRVLRQLGVPASRSVTILNAVVAEAGRDARAVRAELGALDAELVVTVGRYVELKNQALLLEALARIAPRRPRLRAVLIGAGPLEQELRDRAETLGLADVVTVTGERSDAVDVVAAADVFTLTSDTEGLPIALLEAMSLARPICATAVGSIPDTIDDGASGLLVPPRDVDALAAALDRLLDERTLAAQLGAAARETVARRFGVETMVERTLAAYTSAVAARRGAR